MKVLFVASNPVEAGALELTREITELQQRFAEANGEPVSFVSLPNIFAERLPSEIAKHRPDVLHISAHSNVGALSLMSSEGLEVELDAAMLAAFFPPEHPPTLVYLNSCDSFAIAKALTATVPFAIGSTASISNMAARSGAIAFYERILAGATLRQAFDVASPIIRMVGAGRTGVTLEEQRTGGAAATVLHRVPRLIADFLDGTPKNKRGFYDVMFGLSGCPSNTVQVIFFTDDGDFVGEPDELESDLCTVIRSTPVNGWTWMSPEECWRIAGDFRLFAVGVTADGASFSLGSTLCGAIELRYRLSASCEIPADVADAVGALRARNGTDPTPTRSHVARALRVARGAASGTPHDGAGGPGTAEGAHHDRRRGG